MSNLTNVAPNEVVTSARQNLINEYLEFGTHRINTLSLNVGGEEIITSAGTIDFEKLFNVPNYFNKTTDDTDDITDTASNRFTNDTDITRLANTSGTNTGDQNLSGLVPYTGATGNVDLGSRTLTTTGRIYANELDDAGNGSIKVVASLYPYDNNARDLGSTTLKWRKGYFSSDINADGTITGSNLSGTNTGDVSVLDSTEIDFTLTGQQITASLKSGSIDETKLDTSVNSSLDLADTAIQTELDPVYSASQAANITETDITNLGNLSGINTGDQDLSVKLDSPLIFKLDNETVDLGSGNNTIHSFIKIGDSLFCGTRTNPARLIKIHDCQNLNGEKTVVILPSGNNLAESVTYNESTNKLYFLLGNTDTHVVEVNPDTMEYSILTNPDTIAGASGGITTDGTYLYVSSFYTPCTIYKYSFDLTLISSQALDYTQGHSLVYDSETGYLFATGGSTTPWIAKINPTDLSFINVLLPDSNTISDDLALSPDYIWAATEGLTKHLVRIKKSDLSYIYIGTNSYSSYGCMFNRYDNCVYAVYSSPVGEYHKIDTEKNLVSIYRSTTSVGALNELVFDAQSLYFTTWTSPAKIIRTKGFKLYSSYFFNESGEKVLEYADGSIAEMDTINSINRIGVVPEEVVAPSVPVNYNDGEEYPVLQLFEEGVGDYVSSGNSFQFRIYAYKEALDGTKVFSDGYLESTVETDSNSSNPLEVFLIFARVNDAVGYYIEAVQDGYAGITNQGFFYEQQEDTAIGLYVDYVISQSIKEYGTNPDFSVTSYLENVTTINFVSGDANFVGDLTANNLSGVNTGDQTLPVNSDFNLSDLGDVDDTDKAEGKILKVNSAGTHVYVTDESGTDEKVKYDVSDPTAGYIADKFVAGDGISLAEGTGANENKLLITNSGVITETDPVYSASQAFNIDADDITNLGNLSGTNTGDQDLSGKLDIDQTSVQTIVNGSPVFDEGLDVSIVPLRPVVKTSTTGDYVARWMLNETPNDELGVNNGVWTGTPTYADALWGLKGAKTTNGQYIDVADNPALNPTTAITIAFWVKLDKDLKDQDGWAAVVSKGTFGGTYQWGITSYATTGLVTEKWIAQWNTTGGNINIQNTTPIVANNWYHVVASITVGVSKKIYINGVLESSATGSTGGGTLVTTAAPLSIGRNRTTDYFEGTIQDVRIYDRQLTDEEVKILVSQGRTDDTYLSTTKAIKTTDDVIATKVYAGTGVGQVFAVDARGADDTDIINSESGFRVNSVAPASYTSAGNLLLVDGGTNLDASTAYYYSMTFVTARGETNVPNVSCTVTTEGVGGKRKVQITVPVSTDPRVLARRIYRNIGGASQYSMYLLDTINDNTTTTYIDDKTDEQLNTLYQSYFRDNTTAVMMKDGLSNRTIAHAGGTTTRFGNPAGNDNATGGRNTFIGQLCAAYITSGSDNVGVGSAFYTANPLGCVAIGGYAMGAQNSASTVSQAVAIGYSALFGVYDATARSVNLTTAVGYSAGIAGWTQQSTLIGSYAGRYISGTNANYNTYIGCYSGQGTSGSNTSSSNTAVGWNTLAAITSGSLNIAIGTRAGEKLTSETDSVFIGAYAGRYVTAVNNLFIGNYSGTGVNTQTTGIQNVGIGYGSLRYFTTGTNNTSTGTVAGENISTGSYNTFNGGSAGRYFTTGSYNCFFGINSGVSNNTDKGTGTTNCGFGSYSLEKLTSGGSNTAMGYQSGRYLLSGNNNILLGLFAGIGSTTESGELFINSYNRTNRAGDLANSIIYGQQTSDGINQTLTFNADVVIRNSLTVTEEIQAPSASFAPIPTASNLIYVSKDSNATDTRTGLSKYNPFKPYVTLTAAQTDAVSGDTIVVLPGTYTNIAGDTTNANLGKDGVNWYFYNGAKIVLTGDVAEGEGRWLFLPDSGSSFSVDGFGEFYNTNNNDLGYAHGLVSGGAGEIYFRAKKVIVVCTSGQGMTFSSSTGSKQYLHVDEAIGNGSVCMAYAGGFQQGWIGRATAGADTFWASGDGVNEDSAIQILSADYVYGGAVATDNDGGGTQYLNIKRIEGGALRASSYDALSKVYAVVGNIVGDLEAEDLDSGWAVDCVINSKMIVTVTGEAIGQSAVQVRGGTLKLKGIFKAAGTNQPAITINRVDSEESLIYSNLILDDVTLLPSGTAYAIDVLNGSDPDVRDVKVYSAFSPVAVSSQINQLVGTITVDADVE